ncbi:alcohol dehydrogenase [Angomonas deanei]|uniref:Alcohol dehydrogenase 4 n=1 Tax=Angomonas deanei TaxID=59799 RepID=A0A7G2CIJ2_9TRYP|nr:alcohol dehydrogenase [Angomonas deanei]CAD2219239.1 Iron-containing alcohol dehydrogenase, putative [Angomonas deanei]|eukprot:EPY39735.1 alcohol dehydrogenase [Angomonas deanei]
MMRFTQMNKAASAFYIPSVSFIGAGALKLAGPKIKSLGFKNALIVTDKGIVAAGLIEPALATLKNDGGIANFTIFDNVQPNPTVKNVEDGLKALEESKADCIISIGGGSPQDCAKGIAIVKTNGGKINDYEGLDIPKKPQYPCIAINTTAGTASEITRFSVITDEVREVKMVITTDTITPTIAINDAEMMVKLPKSITAATGMDALTHAVEAYCSLGASHVTDACALQAVRLIKKHLVTATFNGNDIPAREGMSYAEYLAGMAFNSAGLGYVHAMAHQLGAVYHLAHGVCNAILLPHVEDYNKTVVPHRLRDIAEALGETTLGLSDAEAADAAIAGIRKLSVAVEIPSGFKALGVKEDADLGRLADAALKDVCATFNPRQGTKEDIIELYRRSL